MSKYSLNAIGAEFRAHAGCFAGPTTALVRATEELAEAWEEQASDGGTRAGLADEMADVILSLAASGLDLDAAIARKHARNMSASWTVATDGSVKRVKP